MLLISSVVCNTTVAAAAALLMRATPQAAARLWRERAAWPRTRPVRADLRVAGVPLAPPLPLVRQIRLQSLELSRRMRQSLLELPQFLPQPLRRLLALN